MNSLVNRRRVMGGAVEDSILPDGYTRIEYYLWNMDYIKFSNVFQQPFTVLAKITPFFRTNEQYSCLCGKDSSMQFGWRSTGAITNGISSSSAGVVNETDVFDIEGVISSSASDAYYSVNGVNYGLGRTTAGSDFYFGSNGANSPYFAIMKVYDFRIIKDNEELLHFIPCHSDSENKDGLYDIINNEFYSAS